MIFAVSLIGAAIWGAVMFGIFYLRQTPRAQVRRRIMTMIERAEAERARAAQQKKAAEPVQVQQLPHHRSFYVRVIEPTFKKISDLLHSLTPPAIKAALERYIFRAGAQGTWSVQKVTTLWFFSVVVGVLVAFVAIQQAEYLLVQKILLLVLGGLIGAGLPFLILRSKIRKRQKLLRRQLPEFLDLLCVSVQAGLSFDGAVAKITGRLTNTLSDEFRHMQDDVRFGMTKQYALTQMAKRCDIEEVYLFTTSVIQAEKLGTSMAQTLTLQADNMRDRHRQFVRAEAMRAPVKMLFPMVLFIFPAIFVVLLMPSVITLVKTLGS